KNLVMHTHKQPHRETHSHCSAAPVKLLTSDTHTHTQTYIWTMPSFSSERLFIPKQTVCCENVPLTTSSSPIRTHTHTHTQGHTHTHTHTYTGPHTHTYTGQ